MMSGMDAVRGDPWIDDSLSTRAAAVLRTLYPALGISADCTARIGNLIEDAVAERYARQDRDFAEIGAPFVKTNTPTAEQVGYRTFTEQFVRPHALAHKASETGDPQGIAAAWWLAHHWWQSLNPAAQPRSADTDEGLADLALALAVPMNGLPTMIGEHLGGTDPVRPQDLRTTLGTLTWEMEDDRMVVTGTCPHPAIDVAIRTYFSGLELPADFPRLDVRIRPTLNADGRASYLAPGAKFHMDEDRVRTLLMGEALYGGKDLAIRELYHNAVDATRHAKARIEWLRRTPAASDPDFVRMTNRDGDPDLRQDDTERQNPPYSGHVHFTQGEEDGHEYIDCTDNGVGMGLEEITTVFSQAGMRSADLPEFVTELDDYEKADPSIELWTNSRFGIGALSYFMLAESVEVTTTRLNRDGTLGPTLHFTIDDPGSVFTITQLAQTHHHGTTVRLWLKEPGTSVAAVMGKILRVAPVRVSIDDPGLGLTVFEADQFNRDCVPDLAHRVWWISDNNEGGVLSDGLETYQDQVFPAAYIDCRGPHAPTLSVDRKDILAYDQAYVDATLVASVDTLVATASRDRLESLCPIIFSRWKDRLPWIVQDRFSDVLSTRDAVRGQMMETTTNLARSGYFHPLRTFPGSCANWIMSSICLGDPERYPELGVRSWPSIVRPRPSDALLADQTHDDLPLSVLAVTAAQSGRPVAEVEARYETLGYHFPGYRPDLRWDDTVVRILANDNVKESSLSTPVPEMAIADLSMTVRIPIHEVVQILDEWGVPHEEVAAFAERRPTLTEQLFFCSNPSSFARQRLTGQRSWRHKGEKITPPDVRAIAQYLGKGLREVAQMARDLGFQALTPRVDTWPDEMTFRVDVTRWTLLPIAERTQRSPDELVEMARDVGWDLPTGPSLAKAPDMGSFIAAHPCPGPLHRSAVLIAHQASSTPIDELIAAFEWAGFELVGPGLEDMDSIDCALTTIENRDDYIAYSVLDVGTALNPYEVMLQAANHHLSAAEALHRYLRLGFKVDRMESVIEPTLQLLRLVVRERFGTSLSFYNPGATVYAADVLQASRQNRLGLDEILPLYAALGLNAQDPRVVLPVRRPGGNND